MYSTGGILMETERRYIKIVIASLILEVILYLYVRYNSGLSELYYADGFTWFVLVFGISAIFRCVYPGILYFEKKPDTLHGIYFYSILASNVLFISLIYIAYNNFEYEITNFANVWTLLSLVVGFTTVLTAVFLIGGGLKFWAGSAVFFTAILSFARLLYFYGQYGLAIRFQMPLEYTLDIFRLDVIYFILVGILQINYVRKIYHY